MKYFKGSIYLNSAIIGIADISAYIIMNFLQKCISSRKAFIINYLAILISSTAYLLLNSIEALIPVFILGMRLSLSMSFAYSYFVNYEYFPTQFGSTIFACSNVAARFVTILAPMAVEVLEEKAFIVLGVIAGLSALGSSFLRKPSEEQMIFKT